MPQGAQPWCLTDTAFEARNGDDHSALKNRYSAHDTHAAVRIMVIKTNPLER
jgi:hypothetical protein